MFLALLSLIAFTIFVSSSDLKVYGYVFNVNGDRLSRTDTALLWRRTTITASMIDISNDFNLTTTNAFSEITYTTDYMLSFKYNLNNIDDKNVTKFLSLYQNHHSWNPTIISQTLNSKTKLPNEYFVITCIEILCDMNVDETHFKYLQINQICDGNISHGRVYKENNETFFTVPRSDKDEAIMNFFADGNSYFRYNFLADENESESGSFYFDEVQYDSFYPNRKTAAHNDKCCEYEQISNVSETDSIVIMLKYNECNTQIMYDNPWTFKEDIEQTGFFDVDLMNDEYKEWTNNGSFSYYGVGGVCAGIFCDMEGINWIEPVIATFAPTSTPTDYPTQDWSFPTVVSGVQETDRKWRILGVVFIDLFVLSCVVLGGGVIYFWSQKTRAQKINKSNDTVMYEQVETVQGIGSTV